jgi:integrase
VRECRYKIDTIVNPELGRLHLSKLTARHLDLLYRKMTDRGLKPRTVRTVHAVLSAALHQAEKWDLVDRPVTTRATPPTVHADQVVAPTPAEVRKLLDQAETVDPALAALLLIAALTGARRGELCALRWSDLNWQAGVLTIARSVYEVEGGGWAEKSTKTHQSRRVGLDELGLAVLRRHRGNVEKLAAELELPIGADAFMFSQSPTGLEPYRPNHVTQFTRRMAKMAGVKTHVHGLRHFSATQLIAGGYDVRTVAGRLGHADASVTLRVYSHVLPERDLGVGGELRIGYAIGAKFPPAAGIAKAVRVRSEGYAREKVLGGRHQVLRRVQVSLFAKDRHRFKGDWPVSVQTDREING